MENNHNSTEDNSASEPKAVISPTEEIEMPGASGDLHNEKQNYSDEKLSPKDSSAFYLTVWCLAAYVVCGLVISFAIPDQKDDMIREVFSMLKYVITTSLGFFFATSAKKGQ